MVSLQIFYMVIAVSSITTNSFVCLVFFHNKTWLKRPYNVFILSLAVTDIMTGVMMFIAPGMIFKEAIPVPKQSMFFGTIYCKVLWTYWSVFALGALSVYTCLALTIERWTAICRPFQYRSRFATKRLAWYILAALIAAAAVTSAAAAEAQYHQASLNFTKPRCSTNPLVKGHAIGFVATILAALKVFIPSIVILILYCIAILKLREVNEFQIQINRDLAVKNVTKMAAAASVALIVCWTPNQIYFLMHKFRKAGLFTPLHNVTILLVFVNSTINPFIYALWGKQFRSGIKGLIHKICSCRMATRAIAEGPTETVGVQGQSENIGDKGHTGVSSINSAADNTIQETTTL